MNLSRWSYEVLFKSPTHCKLCGSAIVKTKFPIQHDRKTGRPTRFQGQAGLQRLPRPVLSRSLELD